MPSAVILNLPEHGHMNATFPVVAELVRRGERVRYYATEPFRACIEESGAEYVSYGAAEAFQPPAHTGGLYSVMAWSMGLAEQVLPRLLDDLRADPPDYLLIDSMCIWGALAQQVLQIPAMALGSVFVPNPALVSMEEMVRTAYGRAPQPVLLAGIDALNTYIERAQRVDRSFGTRSPDIVEFFAGKQARTALFTSRMFHPRGEEYDPSYEFVGPSIAPRPEAMDLPLDESDPRPLLYISLGTIFHQAPEFYRSCFAAFGDGPWRVVLAAGGQTDVAGLGPAPGNFIVRRFVSQLEVLRRASVFLTHGGMNSVSEALWFGVPLLVYPQHGDQHLVAARVQELGAGLRLTLAEMEPARLRELLERVMTDVSFRHNAGAIRESFRAAGGYVRAAQAICEFGAQTRTAQPADVAGRV